MQPFQTDPAALSRREAMQAAGWGLLGLTFFQGMSARPALPADESGYTPLNRFPRMTQEYFVRRLRRFDRENAERVEALKTRADAEAYVASVRKRIMESFGPFPERTPLNPRVTGRVERDAYTIENLIFESRPGFLVTANLYVPKGREFPLPGVVGTCGHSTNGKASEYYQGFSQGLARQGYVVLIYDPIGQGERLQYVNEDLGSRVGVGVREHLYAGNQQFLVNEFIGSWRAWDGIRALDYLLTREEVDPNHIGVTGNSGGGTMTTWLCGVEDRWSMGAPSCFVTTFRRNMENELPADTEQCPPRALALGLDHSDFIAAMAPKPVILLAKEKDYFDVRGTMEAYDRLRHIYGLLGAEENIGMFVGPTYHGYSQENREAMYRWFNRATNISDAQTEPKLTIEPDEALYCAPRGQVSELGSKTVFDFTKAKAEAMAGERKPKTGDALKEAVRGALKLPPARRRPPAFRILRVISAREYPKPRFTTYCVETEPGVQAIVYRLQDEPLYSRPPEGPEDAILYVSHLSSDAELRNEPLIRQTMEANPGAPVFTSDVRGIGESMPNTCGTDFFNPYGPDYFYAIHSIMLDEPYIGRKTHDVLRVLDWMAEYGHTKVHLAAMGWGTIPAAFAALLAGNVSSVTLKRPLKSYKAIAVSEEYDWPLSSLLPNALGSVDLPEVYAALRDKGLRMIDEQGAVTRG